MSDPAGSSPLDLAAAYALGALDDEERRAFEAWLATSPEGQREVAEFREVAALIAVGAGPGTEPSAALRERVIAQRPATEAARTNRAAPVPARRRPWLTVALVTGMAASLLFLVQAERRRSALGAALAARDSAVAQVRGQLAARDSTLAALLAPDVQVYELASTTDRAPGARLFLNRARHTAVLQAFRLRAAAAGRTYQLWFIRDGVPVPSVTFNADASGGALMPQVDVPGGGAVSAAAITEEPAGGSAQPTSPVLLSAPIPSS